MTSNTAGSLLGELEPPEPSWKCAVGLQFSPCSSIWLAALLPKAVSNVTLPPISDGQKVCSSAGRIIFQFRHAENGRRQQALLGTSHFSPSHAISHCRSSVSPPRSNLRVSHNPLLSRLVIFALPINPRHLPLLAFLTCDPIFQPLATYFLDLMILRGYRRA